MTFHDKTMPQGEREDFYKAFIALKDEEKMILYNFSSKMLQGTRYESGFDLLNEAIDRVLRGSRTWERSIPFTAFLYETMRSIASIDTRYPERRALSYEEWLDSSCDTTARPENEYSQSPEELLCRRQETQRAARTISESKARLSNDAKAIAVIDSISRDMTPAEARKEYGMSEKDYKAARERFANDIRANIRRPKR
jgi:DNA-directed RNA polymerase specialized sigma24 family protein